MLTPTFQQAFKGIRLVFLALWGLIWTAVVLIFDALVVHNLAQLQRVQHYASTQGVVVATRKQELARHPKNPQLKPGKVIAYQYQVKGKTYEGTRVRVGMGFGNDSAYKHIKHLKPGDAVTVYYDPQQPDQAVLTTQVQSGDFALLVFLLPFNCVMLGFWGYVVLGRSERAFASLLAGLVLCGGVAFLSGFVLVPLTDRPDPLISAPVVATVPLLLVALGAATGTLAYLRPDSIWYRMGKSLTQFRSSY